MQQKNNLVSNVSLFHRWFLTIMKYNWFSFILLFHNFLTYSFFSDCKKTQYRTIWIVWYFNLLKRSWISLLLENNFLLDLFNKALLKIQLILSCVSYYYLRNLHKYTDIWNLNSFSIVAKWLRILYDVVSKWAAWLQIRVRILLKHVFEKMKKNRVGIFLILKLNSLSNILLTLWLL